jgi:hypothetical protein
VKWFKKEKRPPFVPATTAQIGSIWHNLQFFEPGDPEWEKAMSMMVLTGPPDKEESYNRVSIDQASNVLTYLMSFG